MNHTGTIKTVEEFKNVVNGIQFGRIEYSYTEFYRGQSRDAFKLVPNLARKITSPNELMKVEKEIIEEFKYRVKEAGKIDKILMSGDPARNEWEWVCQAQHYRLPTRFMDWTIKPEIALFFAVGNPRDDAADGQLWVFLSPLQMFKTDGEPEEYFHQHPYIHTENILLNPCFFWTGEYKLHIAEKRRAAQYGRFSITSHASALVPLEENPDMNIYLNKYVIPKESKPLLREYLTGLGYSDESIYVEEDAVITGIVSDLRTKYGV